MLDYDLKNPSRPRWPMLMGLTLFGTIFGMACLRYLALRSTVFDLGIFVSNLTAMAEGGEWWRALNGHVQLVLWFYAWVVKVLPHWLAPLGLMATQALLLALPLPLLGKRYGTVTALAYFLSYAVWHNGLFDFHPDHLAIPLGFFFFFMAEDDRPWMAALAALSLCLVKETFALQAAACGLYLMTTKRGGPAGFAVLVLSLAWFWLATAKLLPFYTLDSGVGLGAGAFSWMGGKSLPGKLGFILLHPVSVVGHVFGDPRKLRYILAAFGSLAFLPLLAPRPLLVALPPLAISLLSSRPDYYGLTNHYTAGLIAPLIVAFAMALTRLNKSAWRRDQSASPWTGVLALALLAGHVALSPSPISLNFWRQGGPAVYSPSERAKHIIRVMETVLPDDPEVVVIDQNSLNWGKAACRYFHNSFPLAVFEPHLAQDMREATLGQLAKFVFTGQKPEFPLVRHLADYVVLDLKRPWYVVDQGCEWKDGACQNQEVAAVFQENVTRAKKDFDTVVDEDGFMILKRKDHEEPEQPESGQPEHEEQPEHDPRPE
jgi:uncharacterized membrane protein